MAKAKYKEWLTEEGLILLEGWARDGLTDEQIAHNMTVSVATLYNYKKNHLEILEALKKGKAIVDYEVENALLKKALEGDTTAAIFWLKNRKPSEWRDKKETELSGGVAVNPFTNLTEEELRKLANQNE